MKKLLFSSLFLAITSLTSLELHADSLLGGPSQDQHIIVNNRILAKANAKAISVIDVMKKLDLLFYRQYPQYASNVQARFQFYQTNWKSALDELIDKELILVDAEEMKLKVNQGDVRQEMESVFGPNIIINLDKAGLTYDEAYQLVFDDITIRRMLYFRVHMKVLSQVTPQKIREFYNEIADKNIRDNEWIFNVVTIRQRDSAKAGETANLVYNLLTDDKISLNDLLAKLDEMKVYIPKQKNVTVSEEFKTNEKELSDVFKQILTKLSPDTYSLPIAQKSRSDNSSVFRIFYLKSMVPGGVIPFSELETKIKNKLLDEGVSKETEAYFKRQRKHFDIQEAHLDDSLSPDFQPFTLSS